MGHQEEQLGQQPKKIMIIKSWVYDERISEIVVSENKYIRELVDLKKWHL